MGSVYLRRLLIKLVAIETALVGWLSYWIFLVYANNPSISAGLIDQLTRFPQLAFTTVDIAVMLIIASFAIVLAFKFHRGLRPGIRLERALQMLERAKGGQGGENPSKYITILLEHLSSWSSRAKFLSRNGSIAG